jgi:AcrR family transcriptional regulator
LRCKSDGQTGTFTGRQSGVKAEEKIPLKPQTELVRVRRRQSRAIETRAKILKAAIAEFADKGFEGTSTRVIAEHADVRHALLIYHFQSKRGIWEAVMTDVLSSFRDTFDHRLAGLAGVDDITKLQLLHADFIRMAAARPELHWLMSHEAGKGGDRIDWIAENLLGNFTTWTTLIDSAQQAGCYVAGNPLHLHYVFIGAAARIFMLAGEVKLITGRSPFDADFIEEHILVCRNLFFRDPPARRTRARTATSGD